jgi:hypothetical protein
MHNPPAVPYDTCDLFDALTSTWITIQPLIAPRVLPATTSWNNELLFFVGGYVPLDSSARNDIIEIFNVTSRQWLPYRMILVPRYYIGVLNSNTCCIIWWQSRHITTATVSSIR